MTGLNDNYKRRILTSLQYADKLLEDGLHALAPGARPLFSGFVQDLSAAESRCVESYARKIREQMAKLLERCHIELSIPAIPSSGKIRTGLNSMDITLEDIYPEKMRGYGKMDASAARDLSWNLQEIRRLINLLLTFLSESRARDATGLVHAPTDPELAELMETIGKIIANHGLVEFLPAMNALTREIQARRFEIGVFGGDDSEKSSFINHLLDTELLPAGRTSLAAFPVRIVTAARPRVRISFLDRVEEHSLAQLAAFATEEGNPRNAKRVVAVEASVSSAILKEGMALVVMPPGGYFSLGDHGFAGECLPALDFGLVLIDGRAAPGHDDWNILKSLQAAGIPSAVWISNCDLLSPAALAATQVSIRNVIAGQLSQIVEIFPIGSNPSLEPDAKVWFEQPISPLLARSRTAFLESIGRKARSLQASVLSTLEMRAGHANADGNQIGQSEEILRRMDECLASFQQHWEKEFDRMAGWAGGILDQAVSVLTPESPVADPSREFSSNQVAAAVMSAIASHFQPFLKEYHDLSTRIGAELIQLKAIRHTAGLIAQELPRPSSMPAPIVSFLRGGTIQPPRTLARSSQATRARHFRRELEEKFAAELRQMLEEMQPRFRRWFMMTTNALKESMCLQTDPIRFRSPAPAFEGSGENLIRDIDFLRGR